MEAGPTTENGVGKAPPAASGTTHAAVNALSVFSFHTWSDHALGTINSVAALVGLVAAAVLLVSLAILYFSGHEMNGRVRAAVVRSPESALRASVLPSDRSNGNANPESRAERKQVMRLTNELTEARSSAEAKRADLAKAATELDRLQKSEKAKTERVAKLENDVATIRRSEEEKSSRVAQLEGQISELRRGEDEKATRISEMQKDMETARRTSEKQAVAARSTPPTTEAGRLISETQRTAFMQAVQGLPTGQVIISAFFENKETHDFGRSILKLLKDAGFTVVEQAPVNFFTTSRPSGGVRIGCEDMAHPPAHFATLRKGFEAMGIEIPDSSVVNADATDIVEIQITPKD
jgi:hypothetical protein